MRGRGGSEAAGVEVQELLRRVNRVTSPQAKTATKDSAAHTDAGHV